MKTQICYAANLFGNVEEEHAGGAIAFASYNLGDEFVPDSRTKRNGRTLADVVQRLRRPDGHAARRVTASINKFPNLIYIPEDAARLRSTAIEVWWTKRRHNEQVHPAHARQHLHDCPPASKSASKNTPAPLSCASSAPPATAPSATSPAPSPAAANAKSPRASATTCSTAPSSSPTSRKISTSSTKSSTKIIPSAGRPMPPSCPTTPSAHRAPSSAAERSLGSRHQTAHPHA